MKKQYWWSYGVTSFVFRISLKSSKCIENEYAFISCIRIEKNNDRVLIWPSICSIIPVLDTVKSFRK